MGVLKPFKFGVALFILLTLISCWPTKDLKNFTLHNETKNVDDRVLKTNGVYYTVQKRENYKYRNYDNINCFVLYENGTYLNLNSAEISSSIDSSITKLISHFAANKKEYSSISSFWGAFKIINDTLFLERYHHFIMPRPGTVTFTSKVFDYRMKILNDTTLMEIGERDIDEHNTGKYYLFKTTNKPDSTNLFMTNKRIKRKLDRLYEKRHRSRV